MVRGDDLKARLARALSRAILTFVGLQSSASPIDSMSVIVADFGRASDDSAPLPNAFAV